MKHINQFKKILSHQDTYVYLISGVLSLQLLDFAYGSIGLMLFSTICLINAFLHKTTFNKSMIFPLVYFLSAAISLLWSFDNETVLINFQKILPFFFIPFSFSFIKPLNRKDIEKALKILSRIQALYILLLLMNAILKYSNNADVFFYHELSSLFDLNAIYLSSFLLLSYVFLLMRKTKSKLDYCILFLLFITLILLSSKLIFAILILVSLTKGLMHFKKPISKLIFITSTVFSVIIILNNTKISERISQELNSSFEEVLTLKKFNNVYLWTGSSIRLFQGRVFLEMLQEDKKYLFGYGFNSTQERITAKHIQFGLYPGFYKYNFHNQYLQTTAELGFVGLFVLVAMFISFFSRALNSISIWPLMIGAIFLILFLTESYLVRQRGIVYFLFYYCLIIKYAHQR